MDIEKTPTGSQPAGVLLCPVTLSQAHRATQDGRKLSGVHFTAYRQKSPQRGTQGAQRAL